MAVLCRRIRLGTEQYLGAFEGSFACLADRVPTIIAQKPVDIRKNAEVWEKIVHELRTGDMLPPDESQLPPRRLRYCAPG